MPTDEVYSESQGEFGPQTAASVAVVVAIAGALGLLAAAATPEPAGAERSLLLGPPLVASVFGLLAAVPTFRLRVDRQGVHYRYWPIHRTEHTVPAAAVADYHTGTPYWPGGVETVLGWGISYWRYWLWPASPGVRVRLTDGRSLFVCSRSPERLARAVGRAVDDPCS